MTNAETRSETRTVGSCWRRKRGSDGQDLGEGGMDGHIGQGRKDEAEAEAAAEAAGSSRCAATQLHLRRQSDRPAPVVAPGPPNFPWASFQSSEIGHTLAQKPDRRAMHSAGPTFRPGNLGTTSVDAAAGGGQTNTLSAAATRSERDRLPDSDGDLAPHELFSRGRLFEAQNCSKVASGTGRRPVSEARLHLGTVRNRLPCTESITGFLRQL